MCLPKTVFRHLPALLLILCLGGCSGGNDNAPALDASGRHPADWLTGHRTAFAANQGGCRECHGSDLRGGITRIDCFNQGSLPSCHAGGHGPRLANHPLPFGSPALHGPDARRDLLVCQGCHGQPGGPGSNPRFTVPIGSLTTGCEAAGCHLPNMAHPRPWIDHAGAGNQGGACPLCHGATFGGGSGPACAKCHSSLASGALPQPGQCVSCHGSPPAGTAFPDIAGSHAVHTALGGVDCATCHNGFGTGSLAHYSSARVQQLRLPANMAFAAPYNARSGPASFAAATQTCTNTSCHGGQPTPAWGTPLDVNTGCPRCHEQGTAVRTPQFNSFFSGRHAFHLGLGLFCTDCHDMGNQTPPSHFSNLSSAAFDQPPGNTIRSFITYSKSARSCLTPLVPPAGTQFTACHADLRFWGP